MKRREFVDVVKRRVGFTVFVDEAITYRGRAHFISCRGFSMASCGFGRASQRLSGRPLRAREPKPTIAITCLRCAVVELLAANRKRSICGVSL